MGLHADLMGVPGYMGAVSSIVYTEVRGLGVGVNAVSMTTSTICVRLPAGSGTRL